MTDRPLKIAFLSQYFYPEQFSNNDIAAYLVERGHEVDVVSCVPNYPAGKFFPGYSNRENRRETWRGVRIFRARTAERRQGAIRLLINFLVYPFAAIWTLMTLRGPKHDVSFVSMPSPIFQTIPGIWLKWIRGVPLVYWVQDIWPESALYTMNIKNRLIARVLMSLCGWLYRRADLVLVQSEAFPDMMKRFGIPDDKIRVFPNTASAQFADTTEAPSHEGLPHLPDDALVLLFAGNIGESQDFETLIEAADQLRSDLPHLHWIIVGSGRAEAAARANVIARDLGHVFHFIGRFPPEDMPRFYAHADALLVSLKDTPIFRLTVPYKIQSYMASGRPIIASLTGEGARIIGEARAGLVAPASDPDTLAAEIKRFAQIAAAGRQQLGRQGRAYFTNNYAPEMVYPKLEHWLQETARAPS